jgi:two-component system, NtrC family, sensor histidine kinase HydH
MVWFELLREDSRGACGGGVDVGRLGAGQFSDALSQGSAVQPLPCLKLKWMWLNKCSKVRFDDLRLKLPLSQLSFRWQITLLGALVVVLFLAVLVAALTALRYTTSAVLNDEKKSLSATTSELVREYEERDGATRTNGEEPLMNASAGSSRELLTLLTRIVLQKTQGNVAGFYSSATDGLVGYTFSGRKGAEGLEDLNLADDSDLRPAVVQVARTAVLTGRPSEQVLGGIHDFTLVEAAPIRVGQNYVGSAWAMESLPSIPGTNRFRAYVIAVALGAAALFCVLLTLLVVRNLQNGVRKIEGGLATLEHDLASQLPTGGDPNEIQRIALAINRLGAALRENIERERLLENRLRHSERLSALGKLVAGVAHEVRNPLATIRLRVQMCQRNSQDANMQESYAVALQEIERLNSIVNRLLNFAEPMSLRVQPTKVSRLVEQRLDAFREIAEKNGVRFATDFRDDGNTLSLDQGRMAQVFDNIIQNAVEAMSERGGTLSTILSAKHMQGGDKALCIEFRDTGKGISSGLIGRIFDPFFTTKVSGTGLGLSICHELVRAHQGEINVESREGQGTIVRILLPLEARVGTVAERRAV